MKHLKFLFVGAAIALSLTLSSAHGASIGNQSEGSSIRDNPALTGGIRGDGKMQANTESVVIVHSAAAETSHIVKATGGFLFWFEYYNGNAAVRYVQLFDSATLPANATVPLVSIPVAATSAANRAFRPSIYFVNGIVIANSTTQPTLTIGSADGFFSAGAR